MEKTEEYEYKMSIKREIIKIIDFEAKKRINSYEANTEGSLTETIQYLSINDVVEVLDICFNETFDRANSK